MPMAAFAVGVKLCSYEHSGIHQVFIVVVFDPHIAAPDQISSPCNIPEHGIDTGIALRLPAEGFQQGTRKNPATKVLLKFDPVT